MATPEASPYPSDAELFAAVISHKFLSLNNLLGETALPELRAGEDSMQIFPTTELPGHRNPTDIVLTQPRTTDENPSGVNGPRVAFTESHNNESVEHHVLVHIRNGKIHERVHAYFPEDREGSELFLSDAVGDEVTYGLPVEDDRAKEIIWWIESAN
ncbi:MAG TPA: hypothetical protein VFB59_04600 [Candidatus Saccharimonadales bacterium]|nr:hypothetical protein [Candidatus Saccharimonadales bacterium]